MQAELARTNEENRRLKNMLSDATNNYNALHVHLIRLMQQRNLSDGNTQFHEVASPVVLIYGGNLVEGAIAIFSCCT